MRTIRSDGGRAALALAITIPALVGTLLVAARDVVGPPVIALALACTVVVAARAAGRPGGVAGAVSAALTFDVLFTEPYLSLKIASRDDVLITGLLLVVGLAVGTSAGRLYEIQELARRRYRATSAVTRVLAVSHEGPLDDVELAVRAELIELLQLRDCWFTTATVPLPVLEPMGGWLPGADVVDEGFTLPADGVVVPVVASGETHGWLVCHPKPGTGVPTSNRRVACALGEVLGLALSSERAA